MPKLRIKKVIIFSGKDSNVQVKVNREELQNEKIDLLRKQNEILDARVAAFENAWHRRIWRYLNKPIGVLPW